MGVRYHYFYNASMYLQGASTSVCGTFSTFDKSHVFDIVNVKALIGVVRPDEGVCHMVHSLSYLGESEDDHGI